MTSKVATNFVFSKLKRKHFLEANEQGQPLQGQVPLTYQVYSGTGGETVVYDGSDVFVLNSTLSGGNLVVDFSAMQNWYGRSTQFIAYRTLLNDCTMDFGTGDIYFPPFTGSSHNIVLTPTSSPATAKWVYVDPSTAVVTYNPSIPPSRIIPGSAGQVLTTNASTGVVDWEDPVAVSPKTLAFKVSTDASNDYNTNTAVPLLFEETLLNDTTLTLLNPAPNLVSIFTVTTKTKYTISYSFFSVHDPTIASRGFIGINSDIWCYQESALGLTGQTLTGSVTLDLDVGDTFAVYVGNAAGTVTPLVPTQDYYGTINVIQY